MLLNFRRVATRAVLPEGSWTTLLSNRRSQDEAVGGSIVALGPYEVLVARAPARRGRETAAK